MYPGSMPRFEKIPSLPSSWPFELRGAGSAFETRMLADLPGMQGAWNLVVSEGLTLSEEPEAMEGRHGRGGVYRLGEVVVRPYRRGGWIRHFDETLYLNPSRFFMECMTHRALWAAGFPTVEPLGYGYRRRLWGVEGVYLTRFEASEPWPSRWDDAGVLQRLRPLLEALDAWGLWAPDLNATNVLVAPDGGLRLLDWDRAAWTQGPLMPKYARRLACSLKRLGAPGSLRDGLQAALGLKA